MILEILQKYINKILKDNNKDYSVNVKQSNRPELCDYQIDDAFRLAKELHKSPINIGNEILELVKKDNKFNYYFKSVDVVMPGFINLTISNELINDLIRKMYTEEKFGLKKPEKKELFFLDYGGPNVAKPLHVGHMRTAIVGESIKRIIKYMGHDTLCDVHLGDYGLQIGQVIYGILQDNKKEDEITLEYLEELYPKMSGLCKEDEKVKEICANITKELQDGNEEYQRLFKIIYRISVADIKRLYDYLGVKFDLWLGESDSYPYIPEVEKMLNDKKLLEQSEGALVINVSQEDDKKEVPPVIFKKNNGAYLYATTDIAAIYERENKYQPDNILYIVDNRQNMHFEQVFRAVKKANITDANLEFLGYGTVNGTDGKPYKTRKGDAPKLDSLFNQIKEIFKNIKESNEEISEEDQDKIVNSILKFADLQNNRDRDYIFDIQKFANVIGKTGPYMLYTCVRINKILEQEKHNNNITNNIYNDVDRALRLKLIEFDMALTNAFNNRMPSYITEYIYNVAVLTNAFYQKNHINNLEDIENKNDWLYILDLTSKVLKEMLDLIGIEIPSIM